MTANSRENPQFTPSQEYIIRGDTGALVQKIDKIQSKRSYRAINTAHNTATDLVATANMLSGKRFVGTYLSISNRETYALRVELFDGTTQKDEFQLAAGESLVLIAEEGIWTFSTSINFKTQSGQAFSAGTAVAIAGIWVDS